ncbi:MAG: [FeFe] hydrogenase H-cluster radical SAM maturase HydE, partial [Bacteroidales bacterium]|nr:[FeFe] hydrogenase H-cluster radical SAM maturase HydE [Bacteroidales bacterium]
MFFSRGQIIEILSSEDVSLRDDLCARAHNARLKYAGEGIHYRGLIEISNLCRKNCLYCGIRRGNKVVTRYDMPDNQIFELTNIAYLKGYDYVMIQAGERQDASFISRIESIIATITQRYNGKMKVALSLGEQTEATYSRWHEAGAARYLLRIEASNENLYHKIHPCDNTHSYDVRKNAVATLKKCGFLTGSGVMIGLPFQTIENLADDLLWLRDMEVDMCGMGPYIPHSQTPLYQYKDIIPSEEKRVDLTLKMTAILRLMMPHINIASTTALSTLHPDGSLSCGANVLMPRLTPCTDCYKLYDSYE